MTTTTDTLAKERLALIEQVAANLLGSRITVEQLAEHPGFVSEYLAIQRKRLFDLECDLDRDAIR